MYLCNKLSIYY